MAYYAGNAAYVDDGTYNDAADDDDYIENVATVPVERSARKSTKGRQLKRWDSDEDQLLLLFCDYTCTQLGNPMPWDAIAAAMEPRDPAKGEVPMTGEAIKQHLAKIRAHRVKDSRRVPPKLHRTARRQATHGKTNNTVNAPITPAPTPKAAGFANRTFAPKAQPTVPAETPVKSSLLAPRPKSKQKKDLQRVKAEAEAARQAKEKANANKIGKSKRGRKPSSIQTTGLGITMQGDSLPDAMRLRPTEPKNYAETSGGEFADIGIKEEHISDDDDDVPLAKKAKLREESTTKPKRSGLLDDTHELWDQRGGQSSANHDNVAQNQGQVAVQQRLHSSPPSSQEHGQYGFEKTIQSASGFQTPLPTSPAQAFIQPPPPMTYNNMGGFVRNDVPPPISDFGECSRRPSDVSTQFGSSPCDEAGSQYFPLQNPAYGQGWSNPIPGSGMSSMSSSFSSNGLEDPFMTGQGQSRNNLAGWSGSNFAFGGLPMNSQIDHATLNSTCNQQGVAFGNSTPAMSYQNQGATFQDSAFPSSVTFTCQSSSGPNGEFTVSGNAVSPSDAFPAFKPIQANTSAISDSMFAYSNAPTPGSVVPQTAFAQVKSPGTFDGSFALPKQSVAPNVAFPKSEAEQCKTPPAFDRNQVTSSNASTSDSFMPEPKHVDTLGIHESGHVVSNDIAPSVEAPQSTSPDLGTSGFTEFDEAAANDFLTQFVNTNDDGLEPNFDMDSHCLPSMASASDRF